MGLVEFVRSTSGVGVIGDNYIRNGWDWWVWSEFLCNWEGLVKIVCSLLSLYLMRKSCFVANLTVKHALQIRFN